MLSSMGNGRECQCLSDSIQGAPPTAWEAPRNKNMVVHLATRQWHFWGFHGAHGPGYMGLVATTWVPMGAHIVTK